MSVTCPSRRNPTGFHRRYKGCRCSISADSPADDCPKHGVEYRTTCFYCGQFLGPTTEVVNERLGAKVGVNYYPGVECEHGYDFCPVCDALPSTGETP